jgi:hypothetical protein
MERTMRTLHPLTRDNLLKAMRREAFAFASFLLHATQAPKRGRPQVAESFEQVAEEEYFGHFAEQALELGLMGVEAKNLHLAIKEEAFEAEVRYRQFQEQAVWAVADADRIAAGAGLAPRPPCPDVGSWVRWAERPCLEPVRTPSLTWPVWFGRGSAATVYAAPFAATSQVAPALDHPPTAREMPCLPATGGHGDGDPQPSRTPDGPLGPSIPKTSPVASWKETS